MEVIWYVEYHSLVFSSNFLLLGLPFMNLRQTDAAENTFFAAFFLWCCSTNVFRSGAIPMIRERKLDFCCCCSANCTAPLRVDKVPSQLSEWPYCNAGFSAGSGLCLGACLQKEEKRRIRYLLFDLETVFFSRREMECNLISRCGIWFCWNEFGLFGKVCNTWWLGTIDKKKITNRFIYLNQCCLIFISSFYLCLFDYTNKKNTRCRLSYGAYPAI